MDNLDLASLLAYASDHKITDKPFQEVYEAWKKEQEKTMYDAFIECIKDTYEDYQQYYEAI